MNFAERGIPVVMLDREQKFLDQASALQQIGRADRRVSRGVAVARLPPAPAAQLYARHTQSAHASAPDSAADKTLADMTATGTLAARGGVSASLHRRRECPNSGRSSASLTRPTWDCRPLRRELRRERRGVLSSVAQGMAVIKKNYERSVSRGSKTQAKVRWARPSGCICTAATSAPGSPHLHWDWGLACLHICAGTRQRAHLRAQRNMVHGAPAGGPRNQPVRADHVVRRLKGLRSRHRGRLRGHGTPAA